LVAHAAGFAEAADLGGADREIEVAQEELLELVGWIFGMLLAGGMEPVTRLVTQLGRMAMALVSEGRLALLPKTALEVVGGSTSNRKTSARYSLLPGLARSASFDEAGTGGAKLIPFHASPPRESAQQGVSTGLLDLTIASSSVYV
jgi:hypothetical protein